MVILDNIIKFNNTIEYNYYAPDNKEHCGHVVFDVAKMIPLNIRYCEEDNIYENIHSLFAKSLKASMLLIQMEEIPTKYEYTWY